MDEFGAYLSRLGDPKASIYEREETEILRELWGLSWGRYDSPEGARDDSEAVYSPALSLLGMSTPTELYRACKSRDVTNGFLNRWMIVEEKRRPIWQDVDESALEVPKSLREGLKRLYQPVNILDQPIDRGMVKPAFRMEFGPGAKEVYHYIRERIEKETDENKRQVFWRQPEKSVRVATDIAAGCLDRFVTRYYMEWAARWVQGCDDMLLNGINEYMEGEKLEFGDLCREIIRRVRQAGGRLRKREIQRSFQNNIRAKHHLQQALDHLAETDQLREWKEETGGRPSIWYGLPEG